jgi:hypothetical protein
MGTIWPVTLHRLLYDVELADRIECDMSLHLSLLYAVGGAGTQVLLPV